MDEAYSKRCVSLMIALRSRAESNCDVGGWAGCSCLEGSLLEAPKAVQGAARSVLDWAVMANTYHLQKFLARCELFIMKHYHGNPSSKAFIGALSPQSQLRIYR